jgi:hypothetical protein
MIVCNGFRSIPTTAPVGYMLAHSAGVEYADFPWELDFSVVDPFNVWSVYVDYGSRQACIALVTPLSVNVPDSTYAVGVDDEEIGYVNGAAFVPGVIRDRLTDLVIEGEYDVYGFRLPCVTVKPAEALTSIESETSLVPSIHH